MSSPWNYQIRIDLGEKYAEAARNDPGDPAVAPLTAILAKHGAVAICQFDAFAGYVAECEKQGAVDDALYKWTKATIENPAKKEKYLRSFTVYAGGKEVYGKEIADALEKDLQPLAGGDFVLRISKYDTNPANNPQPPARYR